jgi:hypothetical protein
MATEALLKIINADGDLKKVTESEEDYIAYQAGQWFAERSLDSDYQGSLGDSDGASIGTFTDTFFNEAVGASGVLTSGSTNSTLKQRFATGAVDYTDNANFYKPLTITGTDTDITAANDTSMNAICDRLLETIFTNDYPGTFRLASPTGAPANHSIHRSNVFTDTRTDGTSIVYNIYKRDAGTGVVPTVVRPVRQETKGSADIKTYNDNEIQNTFGPYSATRIVADGVGAYQLRSSAEGAPVAAGTWVAKGTATDTKQDSANQDYTRNSTRTRGSTFSRNSTNIFTTDFLNPATGNFTRDSTRNSIGLNSTNNFANNFTRTSTRVSTRTTAVNYESAYAGNYISTYTGDFVGNYTGDFTGNYVATFTRTRFAWSNAFGPTFSGVYGTFQRTVTYAGNYDGADFTRNSTRISTRNSINNFDQDFVGNYSTDYTSNYVGNYTGNFVGNYEQIYIGDYIPDYIGNYIGDYDANFEGNYTADYLGDFEGNYAIDYIGDYIGNFEGLTIQVTSSTIETYTLYVRIS